MLPTQSLWQTFCAFISSTLFKTPIHSNSRFETVKFNQSDNRGWRASHYKERHRMRRLTNSVIGTLALTVAASALSLPLFAQSGATITGKAAFTDYTQEHPGVRRKITLADLPEPMPDESVDNGPSVVPRPEGAWPIAPKGFKVEMYAQGFREPRLMRTAPNGDIFLADSHGDKIWVLRGVGPDGKAQTVSTFAD